MLDNNLKLADSAEDDQYDKPPPTDECDDVSGSIMGWIHRRDYKDDDFVQR